MIGKKKGRLVDLMQFTFNFLVIGIDFFQKFPIFILLKCAETLQTKELKNGNPCLKVIIDINIRANVVRFKRSCWVLFIFDHIVIVGKRKLNVVFCP